MSAVAASVLACAACADERNHCPLALTCGPVARFELNSVLLPEMARLAGATVLTCFNGACNEERVSDMPRPGDFGDIELIVTPDPRIAVEFFKRAPANEVEGIIEISGRPDAFHDGDTYRIALVLADGTTVIDQRWTIVYETTQPDGPECGECTSAMTVTQL